jgi:hypothetical protein
MNRVSNPGKDNRFLNERDGPAVTFWTCIRNVLGSNLVRGAGYLHRLFRRFPQSLQTNAGIVLLLPSNIFRTHLSPHHTIRRYIVRDSESVGTGSGAHPAYNPMGTGGSFSGGKVAGGVMLTTHLHPVQRTIMRGALPPLPQTSLWRDFSSCTRTY